PTPTTRPFGAGIPTSRSCVRAWMARSSGSASAPAASGRTRARKPARRAVGRRADGRYKRKTPNFIGVFVVSARLPVCPSAYCLLRQQLDPRRLGAVAFAMAQANDAGIASGPGSETRPDLLEQRAAHGLVADATLDQPPRVQVAPPRQRDQLLGH